MTAIIAGSLISMRPRHWIKNLALYAPIFFAGQLFNGTYLLPTTIGCVAFCLLSSSHYVFNDLLDAAEDRKHPYKKHRPIASGLLPVAAARGLTVALGITGLVLSMSLGDRFFFIAVVYVLLHVANSLRLRTLAVVDILATASGYVLRVYAGGAASGVGISIWLALSLLSLSLFFAMGKRVAEYALTQAQRAKLDVEHKTHYSEKLLMTYMAMFGAATFITYACFTFLTSSASGGFLSKELELSTAILSRKWLMLTIPFVLYGMMRYLQLVFEAKSGTLEKILTTDRPLIVTGLVWLVSAFVIVYGIGIN